MAHEKPWTMPEWMEKYRSSISNTGGNTVEELMNGRTTFAVNAPLAILECCVVAQVGLLARLYRDGIIK